MAAIRKRAKKARKRMCRLVRRNKRLGVFDVMREIREDMSRNGDLISNISDKRRHGGRKRDVTAMRVMVSNKQFKPGD